MATIDLIVLGMLKQKPLSAYEIQKLVEYRNISQWVKISTPSVYKKAIQLEQKGFVTSHTEKEGKMPEKAVYELTEDGKREFERLMLEIAGKPINIFLDFNAVIVNLQNLPKERQARCLASIRENVASLKARLEENISQKASDSNIPPTGMAVLRQQYVLIQTIEAWIESVACV